MTATFCQSCREAAVVSSHELVEAAEPKWGPNLVNFMASRDYLNPKFCRWHAQQLVQEHGDEREREADGDEEE